MKIECTKEEFKVLLDLVYAGNILANGMREKEERIAKYSEMEQKIFAMAKEFGLEDVVEYDEEFKEYMPTHRYEYDEDGVNPLIDAYDEKVFWEELVVKLARRDALNEVAEERPDMTKKELSQRQVELEEMYEEELIENGVTYLKLQKPPLQKRKR